MSPLGDAAGGGTVNVADTLCTILTGLWVQGGSVGAPPGCLAYDHVLADVNCDGVVSVHDAMIIVSLSLQGSVPAGIQAAGNGCPAACVACAPPESSSCHIGGVCVPEGQASTTSGCAVCAPAQRDTAYSASPDGANCGDGKVCQEGECVASLPGAPSELEAVGVAFGASLSWQSPASDGGSPILHYVVRIFGDDGGPAPGVASDTLQAPPGTLPFEVSGLLPLVPYRFAVAAVTAAGEGPATPLSEAALPLCVQCGAGLPCLDGDDCASSICLPQGVCAAASCADGVQNGNETSVDCGGTCAPCTTGSACNVGADCTEGVCSGGICHGPSCGDGVKNGAETGLDCGGSTCAPCALGQSCLFPADCSSGICGPGSDGHCAFRVCRSEPLPQPGGSVDCAYSGADVFQIRVYTEVGTHQFEAPLRVTSAQLLVVGGGGGGGSSGESGSGGGAGGLVYYGPQTPRMATSYPVVPEVPISVIVGAGGAGASVAANTTVGDVGQNSSFGNVVALGGGPGVGANANGAPGGSGSGACDAPDIVGGTGLQPSSTSGGFGNKGGDSIGHATGGSGGGGAGAAGQPGTASSASGHGGAGLTYTISGQTRSYAGGGGGGVRQAVNNAPGQGGIGGGGTGGTLAVPAAAGAPNTGGGGGGAYGAGSGGQPDTNAGSGGSGVVIVRWQVPACAFDDTCGDPACDDGLFNGDETDVDCGGPCAPCPDGSGCAVGVDCQSGVCGAGGLCAAPTCTDAVQNGSESDVDCGGSCPPCALGEGCNVAADCAQGLCVAGEDHTCATRVCALSPPSVSGAEVSCTRTSGQDFEIHIWRSGSGHSFTPRVGVGAVEVLVVAGGGGGGSSGESGSGGGAGGLIYYGGGFPRLGVSYPVTVGVPLAVAVGAGGIGASVANATNQGTNGQSSQFGALVALGGGRGVGANTNGIAGGSGGGACDAPGLVGGAALQPGAASGGFGNPGGASTAHATGGSGGGGAGAAGAISTAGTRAGAGGGGLQYAISGALSAYGGGGGGGARGGGVNTAGGFGGSGGGGNGGDLGQDGQAGAPNSGGGGGGASGFGEGAQPDTNAGAGGSGVVIVRFPVP